MTDDYCGLLRVILTKKYGDDYRIGRYIRWASLSINMEQETITPNRTASKHLSRELFDRLLKEKRDIGSLWIETNKAGSFDELPALDDYEARLTLCLDILQYGLPYALHHFNKEA